jgi:hypothetical protein
MINVKVLNVKVLNGFIAPRHSSEQFNNESMRQ